MGSHLLQNVSLLGILVGGIRLFPSAQNLEHQVIVLCLRFKNNHSINEIFLLDGISKSYKPSVDVDRLQLSSITTLVPEVALPPRRPDRADIVCKIKKL